MIYLISGTNRPESNTLKVVKQVESLYKNLGAETEIIDLQDFPLCDLDGSQYGDNKPDWIQQANKKILSSDGLVVVVPEYNGSLPGVLKVFIDHLEYPAAFYHRPVCFIGLGGLFGGLRPVEHCQQIFGYRNAFIYPDRVFLMNVFKSISDNKITDNNILELLKDQTKGFAQFIKTLKESQLHAAN